jgi:hypothetical protein
MARIAPGTVVARVREALSGARGPSSS